MSLCKLYQVNIYIKKINGKNLLSHNEENFCQGLEQSSLISSSLFLSIIHIKHVCMIQRRKSQLPVPFLVYNKNMINSLNLEALSNSLVCMTNEKVF